jgi:hypothetical protein
MAEQKRPTDLLRGKKRPTWAHEIIQDAKKYVALEGTYRESKKPKPYSSYVALLSDIIDRKPTCYEKAAEKKGRKDAMIEEYQSILKNDVWDVVPRPREKSVVSSKWIYKVKHASNGSIEKIQSNICSTRILPKRRN